VSQDKATRPNEQYLLRETAPALLIPIYLHGVNTWLVLATDAAYARYGSAIDDFAD
jgi:hypothetical protein